MAGGYISCGEFVGDDKSGSAILGVVDDIRHLPGWDAESPMADVIDGIYAFVSGESVPPQAWSEAIEITPKEILDLVPYLEQCRTNLIDTLGTSDPVKAIAREQESSNLDPSALKWGKGAGWRLYCVIDLLRAAEHASRTAESVFIEFD
jgi:hypothetical protein